MLKFWSRFRCFQEYSAVHQKVVKRYCDIVTLGRTLYKLTNFDGMFAPRRPNSNNDIYWSNLIQKPFVFTVEDPWMYLTLFLKFSNSRWFYSLLLSYKSLIVTLNLVFDGLLFHIRCIFIAFCIYVIVLTEVFLVTLFNKIVYHRSF